MRLSSRAVGNDIRPWVALGAGGPVALSRIDPEAPDDLFDVLPLVLDPAWRETARVGYAHSEPEAAPAADAPYRHLRKILGIGLNYREHADDLGAQHPESPASFLKGDHTIIGPGEPIRLPSMSKRVTAEAEVGLVIGRTCWEVEEKDALDYVAGVVPILDQTAEDILQQNPRFLTRAKNFPTFLSFGPEIVTLDEVTAGTNLAAIRIETVLNGEVAKANVIGNMHFTPANLVAFHSWVMPLFPGDIISTGTPGAVQVTSGDEWSAVSRDWRACRTR